MEIRQAVTLENVEKRFGRIAAVQSLTLNVPKGASVALLGPSGCGKTTTLRMIAGFEQPDQGRVLIDGVDVTGARPYERNVGLVFQDYALFPHMNVEQNVAYGLYNRRYPRDRLQSRVLEMLDLVGLAGFARQRPGKLSGGQQQRVALARALATSPSVLLLDEPLSALDAKLRQELQIGLKNILKAAQCTTIVVTHDQDEAMSLAEHIIVMHEGRVIQEGSPTEIYTAPTHKFVCEFIGRSNWFSGIASAPASGAETGRLRSDDGVDLRIRWNATSQPCDVCVRPERVEITSVEVEGGNLVRVAGNSLPAILKDITQLGADLYFIVELANGKSLTAVEKFKGQCPLEKGQAVMAGFRAEDCIVIPRR
ncbi:ABC transporter ATP-binding protein [Mesorhizobium australicum]|uniref:ABC transporter ATP-binding protein n=1 Tax=Mesorhizobium australicum TaxID=536018 RepID=UPI00333521A0